MKGGNTHPHPPVRCIHNANMGLSHGPLLKRLGKKKIQRDSGSLLPCFFNTLIAQELLVAGIIFRIVKDACTSAPLAMPRYNRFADYFKAHTPRIKLFHIINAPHPPDQAGGPLPLQHEYDPSNSRFSSGGQSRSVSTIHR